MSDQSPFKTTEIVVVSGKGGTGKTSFVACLASLMRRKVLADCDVDAANLHIIAGPVKIIEEQRFETGKKAVIDLTQCTQCGICRNLCRYGAISESFIVDRFACEGCGACHLFCPAKAVQFETRLGGYCYVCVTPDGDDFVFAELMPGEDNSGKLVALVRNQARMVAETVRKPIILIDGPPGIGCPVISSLTGTHMAIVVSEPTPSGLHDLKRIIELTKHFRIPVFTVINRSDINNAYTEDIKAYCLQNDVTPLGDIPYEPLVTEAQRQLETILSFAPDSKASKTIREIHHKIEQVLEELT